jgi:peptide/nickel transport system substrate-binding protein
MKRRTLLASGLAAGASALAAPGIGRAEGASTLRFIPQADLAVLDPIWTTAYVTRNHGYLVFDTLFGLDEQYKAQPQMAEGASTEDGGKTWRIGLRDGLAFHDGTPVLARDCVASLTRWGKRDTFGQALFDAIDEVSAADDLTLVFRLKRAFPLLPDALGKPGSNMPAIMPERLAKTDPFTQVTEMVGSGPYKFLAAERVPGARVAYERFAGYVPRASGTASFTAGPKVAHYDRVLWTVIPDSATAAGALQSGEQDWWENPPGDLMPLINNRPDIRVVNQDPTGYLGMMRPNFLHPPFDNPQLRRAIMGAINQADFMEAAAGSDPKLYKTGVGVFCPVSPMATDVGMAALTGPRDLDRARQGIKDAGYKGEPVVFMGATDFPIINAIANVGQDLLHRLGLNVDYQAMDWGTLVQRRAKHDAPDQGGWSVFCTYWSGLDTFNPATDPSIRGNGAGGWFGWPTFPEMESLRQAWLEAPDLAAQRAIAAKMQERFFEVTPYYPLGLLYEPTAYRTSLTGVLNGGFVLFWNVRPA